MQPTAVFKVKSLTASDLVGSVSLLGQAQPPQGIKPYFYSETYL